jgi:hypothetical protein
VDDLTKYYLGWTLGGLAILAAAAYMVYSYQGSLKPKPAFPESSGSVAPGVAPQAAGANSKGVVPVDNVNELKRTHPEISLLLPQSDEEGTPFVLTDASEHANNAFKLMREQKFNEAVNEYQMAYNLDPRYEMVLKRTEDLVKEIRRSSLDTAKNRRVFPGSTLTYKQLYDWD